MTGGELHVVREKAGGEESEGGEELQEGEKKWQISRPKECGCAPLLHLFVL